MRTLATSLLSIALTLSMLGSAAQDRDDPEDSDFKPFPVVETGDKVITPPEGVHPFYKKYITANGVVIVGAEKVRDASLLAARKTILHLTSKEPKVLTAILKNNPRISIMAFSETASDLPEYGRDGDGQWGLGQMPGDPTALVSEKGVRYKDNPEYIADFLMHEFVHAMSEIGMPGIDPEVPDKIYQAYIKAVEEGRFRPPPTPPRPDAKADSEFRDDEYFTHSVNAYYDLNERLPGPWVDVEIGDWGEHSGTRENLRKNDPVIFKLIELYFPKEILDL